MINSDIILPHNVNAEKATVAAMLIESTAIYEVIDFLRPEMFYNDFIRKVYEAILSVESKAKVDLITVAEELIKKNEEVDVYALSVLTEGVGSSAHISIHARIVYQDYLRRKLILSCAKTMSECNDMSIDVSDLIEIQLSEIEGISNNTIENETVDISVVALEAHKAYIERAKQAENGIFIGANTGLDALDRALFGFQKGNLYILAGRPAMGKTAFLLNIARKTAKKGNNVFIVSLEMTRRSFIDRMTVAESGIDSSDYRMGRLSQDEVVSMAQAHDNISELPIMINDTPLMTVQQIKAQAKKLKRKDKCDIILIDYLQLIESHYKKGRTKNDEVSETTRMLKIMAKELDVPIVLLSQLSRDVEKRGDKIPMLSDLRDSGAIEQDADAVMFIYREHYYNDTADRNRGIIRVAKNREERTGDVEFWVNDTVSDFKDYNLINNMPF